MVAILDLVIFHKYKGLEKNASPFFLITTMFQKGINKKITFNKHFARKYIRAYTINWMAKITIGSSKLIKNEKRPNVKPTLIQHFVSVSYSGY